MVLAALSFGLHSCNTDDDGLSIINEPPNLNQFFYGPATGDNFTVRAAFNGTPQPVGEGVFATAIFITDDNFTVNMNSLQGVGRVVTLVATTNQNLAIQPGRYTIASGTGLGNVSVNYSLDYNTAIQLNNSTGILTGTVRVSALGTGFGIEINGVDENGFPFHGNYLGELTSIN